MKTSISVILCVALVASCTSVRANDTAEQAAARAALEQKVYELDHPDTQSLPARNSVTAVAQPAEPTVNSTKAASAAPASTARAGTGFTLTLPAADASAQAAALAAVQQKMNELNQPDALSASDANAVAAPEMVPANEASAAATPVTESPGAEVPVAVAPAITPAAVAPVSAAPAVVAPAPRVPAAPATAAIAVAPAAASQSAPAPFPSSSPGEVRPANELVTRTGTTYKNVEVQRVTVDAILISYTPAQGGWAMTKVYFRDLPPDIRQHYDQK